MYLSTSDIFLADSRQSNILSQTAVRKDNSVFILLFILFYLFYSASDEPQFFGYLEINVEYIQVIHTKFGLIFQRFPHERTMHTEVGSSVRCRLTFLFV